MITDIKLLKYANIDSRQYASNVININMDQVLAAQLIDRLENHRKVQLRSASCKTYFWLLKNILIFLWNYFIRREHNFEISINETG